MIVAPVEGDLQAGPKHIVLVDDGAVQIGFDDVRRLPRKALRGIAAILEELAGCSALGGDELLKQRRAKYLAMA